MKTPSNQYFLAFGLFAATALATFWAISGSGAFLKSTPYQTLEPAADAELARLTGGSGAAILDGVVARVKAKAEAKWGNPVNVAAHDAYLDTYLALVDRLDNETRARVGPGYASIFKYLYPRVYALRKAGETPGTPGANQGWTNVWAGNPGNPSISGTSSVSTGVSGNNGVTTATTGNNVTPTSTPQVASSVVKVPNGWVCDQYGSSQLWCNPTGINPSDKVECPDKPPILPKYAYTTGKTDLYSLEYINGNPLYEGKIRQSCTYGSRIFWVAGEMTGKYTQDGWMSYMWQTLGKANPVVDESGEPFLQDEKWISNICIREGEWTSTAPEYDVCGKRLQKAIAGRNFDYLDLRWNWTTHFWGRDMWACKPWDTFLHGPERTQLDYYGPYSISATYKLYWINRKDIIYTRTFICVEKEVFDLKEHLKPFDLDCGGDNRKCLTKEDYAKITASPSPAPTSCANGGITGTQSSSITSATAGLCPTGQSVWGFASTVSGNTTNYTWSCNGVSGGNCSASYTVSTTTISTPSPTPTPIPLAETPATNTGRVVALYKGLLGREPSIGEVTHWMGTGKSVKEIADAFIDSSEYKAQPDALTADERRVGSLYVGLFGRMADAGWLAHWKGKPVKDTVTGLTGSNEYR